MGDKYWQWVRIGQGGEIKWTSSPSSAHFVGAAYDLSAALDDDSIWVWVGVYATPNPYHDRPKHQGVVQWCHIDGMFWNIFTDPEKFEEANW